MKRIKARFKSESEKPRPFYGGNGFTSRTGTSAKSNWICPNVNCNYSSRNWICEWGKGHYLCQDKSVSSKNCPHHNLPLVDVGCGSKLPKVGSKERAIIIGRYSK